MAFTMCLFICVSLCMREPRVCTKCVLLAHARLYWGSKRVNLKDRVSV